MPATVNTAKTDRRPLRFESIDDLRREIDTLRTADAAGRLEPRGNWTFGQTLGHVAAWIEYGYDGYPMRRPPFFIRWIMRRLLRRILERGMPAGARIPGVPGGTYGIDDQPPADAADRLLRALDRLAAGEPCPHDSPAFGPMSHADRVRLNLRHAELHLGFFRVA